MQVFLQALNCLISLCVGRHLSRWFIKKPREAGRALNDIIYTLIWQLLNEYLFADRYHLVAGASTDSHTKFWTLGSLSLDRPGSHCSIECIRLLMHYGIQCHKEPQEGAFIVQVKGAPFDLCTLTGHHRVQVWEQIVTGVSWGTDSCYTGSNAVLTWFYSEPKSMY